MLKSLNKTHIILIPRGDNTTTFKDLRPISLCNTAYKIFAKTLGLRLKEIMPKIVHPRQSAFIKDRLISDNVLLAADIVNQIHHAYRRKTKIGALKD